jgi:hypothetical protein
LPVIVGIKEAIQRQPPLAGHSHDGKPPRRLLANVGMKPEMEPLFFGAARRSQTLQTGQNWTENATNRYMARAVPG